jgi:hypothetical protein
MMNPIYTKVIIRIITNSCYFITSNEMVSVPISPEEFVAESVIMCDPAERVLVMISSPVPISPSMFDVQLRESSVIEPPQKVRAEPENCIA